MHQHLVRPSTHTLIRSGPLLVCQFTWKDFKFAPLPLPLLLLPPPPDTVFEAALEATPPPAFEAMVRQEI